MSFCFARTAFASRRFFLGALPLILHHIQIWEKNWPLKNIYINIRSALFCANSCVFLLKKSIVAP